MYRFCIYLFSIMLLMNQISVLAETRTFVTRTPVYNKYHRNYNRYNKFYNKYHNRNNAYHHINKYRPAYRQNSAYHYNTTSFSDLNALERYTLNKNYSRESDLERLQRLEMEAFGAIQSGDINSRYDNVRTAILSRPKQNYRTSILRNIGNFFSGQLTGFTPSFYNDPFFSPDLGFTNTPYPSSFGNQSVTQYSGPFGSGYHINNFGTGSSAGVKILD